MNTSSVWYLLAGIANGIAMHVLGWVLLALVFAGFPMNRAAAVFTHEPARSLVLFGEVLLVGAAIAVRGNRRGDPYMIRHAIFFALPSILMIVLVWRV